MDIIHGVKYLMSDIRLIDCSDETKENMVLGN